MSELDTYLESLVPYVAQQIGVPNLTIDLVKRVIRQESGGNQAAKSKVGAIGLMQLMPATAAELGVDPYDPTQNLYGGVTYLAKQMKRFNGDPALGLAAYNAGAGNVQKYGGIPPFAETQNYVKSILGDNANNNSFSETPTLSVSARMTQNVNPNNTEEGSGNNMQEVNTPSNIQDIVNKYKNNIDITDEELKAFKEYKFQEIKGKYKNNIDISDEELSFTKEYMGIKNTPQDKLEQKKRVINEQKAIDGLNRLAPILDVKLNAQGETVRERYLKKVYGEGNVSVDPETNEFYVKGGGNSLTLAPKPTWQGQTGTFIKNVGAGLAGEALAGSAFGPVGAIAGAGVGAGLGTASTMQDALKAAQSEKLLNKNDLPTINKEIGKGALFSGGLAALTGGLSEAGKFALNKIAPSISPAAKQLKIGGNTGLGIGKMKGEIEQQIMSDDLLKQINPAVQAEQTSNQGLDYFGQAVKTGIGGLIDRIDNAGNKYFNNIDARVKKEVTSGKVQFVDVSNIYNDLVTNLGKLDGKEIPAGTAPQIVERLQNALSGTTGVFNPKTVAAGDFRSAINTISSLYDEGINTFASKPLAQFRTDLTNKALETGGNFAKYKTAFEIFKRKYDLIPEELLGIKSLDTTKAAEAIKGLTKDQNAKVAQLVEKSFDPVTAQQFKTGLMKDTIYRTSVLKSSLRKVPKEVSAEVQAQLPSKTFIEGKEALDSGVNLQMKGVKQTLKQGRQEARSVNEPFVSGKGLSDFFLSKEGDNVSPLLKGTVIDPKLANKLESAQKAAGLITRVTDSPNFSNEAVSAAAPTLEKVIRKNTLGSVAMDTIGGLWNPLQRGLSEGLTSIDPLVQKIATANQSPISPLSLGSAGLRSTAGNLLGSAAGINPATNFSNTALTEEQQKRLIGGVRNGQR
jgi:hypothetical protein